MEEFEEQFKMFRFANQFTLVKNSEALYLHPASLFKLCSDLS